MKTAEAISAAISVMARSYEANTDMDLSIALMRQALKAHESISKDIGELAKLTPTVPADGVIRATQISISMCKAAIGAYEKIAAETIDELNKLAAAAPGVTP